MIMNINSNLIHILSFSTLSYLKSIHGASNGETKQGLNVTSSICPEQTTHASLFSSLLTNQLPLVVLAAIVILIVCVQIVEKFFEFLLDLTEETPFEKVIVLIQQELMIVGFTALLLKVLINVSHFLNHNWFFALEYAGENIE